MSYYNWEPEIEFFTRDDSFGHNARPHMIPFDELALDLDVIEQDSVITYKASQARRINLRVLGFDTTMVVQPEIIQQGFRVQKTEVGQLIGCRATSNALVIPDVLRTHHPTLIRASDKRTFILPPPLKDMEIQPPRSIGYRRPKK